MFLYYLFFISLISNLIPSTTSLTTSSFSKSDFPWRPNENRTLVSSNSSFVAGFLASQNSPNQYIFSIWYNNIFPITVVWSMNHNSPVNTSSPLYITPMGRLRLDDATGINIWDPKAVGTSNGTTLELTVTGSLVYDNWTSFDVPTNTFLPEQPIVNGSVLVSNNGKYKFTNSPAQLVLNGSVLQYWQENNDNAFDNLGSNGGLKMANGDPKILADFDVEGRLRRLTLNDDGNLRVYSYNTDLRQWVIVWQAIQELCTIHGTCGPNYICMSNGYNGISCVCPPGYRESENKTVCMIKTRFINSGDSKFLQLDFVNFSGGSNSTDLQANNFNECKSGCLANVRCLGFGFKFDGKRYCVHQLDRLLYGYWSPGTETAMFLRVSKSETDNTTFTGMTSMLDTVCPVIISLPLPPKGSKTAARNLAIICSLFAIELISGVLAFWAFLKKYIKYRDMARTLGLELLPAGGPKRFSYAELKAATNDFSNVVGHGGFGIVYKGVLPDHRVVAVKRLKVVGGGETEFWAEVTIIARMHHLNLVRMWGFCAEKSQRMLVYEYIPNGSLDKFLFPATAAAAPRVVLTTPDQDGDDHGTGAVAGTDSVPAVQLRPILDWNVRYRIALGVARAIAYLHEECLEWVLHCDIKPENILLEGDFCPKVSDFGLAKLTKKEDKVSMSRIRGTRGYLAPEWVKMEPITAKADVYSFGMVLLEIVSGIRNFEFRRSSLESEDWYFPKWAFEKVYKEKNVEDILDRHILDSYDSRVHFEMVDRMVKTAMWCLQDRAEKRPSMGKVAKMLEGTVDMDEPGMPTIFYLGNDDA
ncbi:hypothetical protein GIB67_005175 [Kingdonia uniflora]|uniref:Receptor-like serine/threonine-protein kinase n=1 Tax=Kingdonia uniflora TaxID=39325 RepID=A0A7J7NN91_9MAGN|nr:hypothetical protein GIB67_005175 [Kingdonia uniflora]